MSNITISSTTSSVEEMTHAAGDDWRDITKLPVAPAPEVEAPEVEETQPETAAAPETAEKQKESKPEKPKTRSQRAIDKLTARNHRLEAELEEARKAPKPAESQPSAPAAAPPSGPPKLQDFLNAGKSADEWADARDAWKEQEAERVEREAERKAEFDEYNLGVSELRAKYDDFDEVLAQSDISIPQSVGNAIVEMGKSGSEVAYYLARHPEICEELSGMKTFAAVGRIHAIAAGLSTPAKSSPEAKTRATPPAPVTPVGQSSTRSSTPLDQLSPSEYIRIRNKQEAERKRR